MAASTSNTSPIQRARQIGSTLPATPVQQAQSISTGLPPAQTPAGPTGPPPGMFGLGNPAAANWGPALDRNQGLSAGQGPQYVPPVIYYNMPLPYPALVHPIPVPNPAYTTFLRQQKALQEAAAAAATTTFVDPETQLPITQSAISAIVDEVIQESNEVVSQVLSTVDSQAPQVDPIQDIVKPPAAITPTELVLENQAACGGTIKTQDISIEIINQINMTSNVSASAIAYSSATAYASASANMAELFKKGCMDPDATNYDPDAVLPDTDSCEYAPPEIIKGCMDPYALNYAVDATEDDGSCTYVPKPPPIPPMSQFLDSHGQIIFEVPKELVEDEGTVPMPKGNTVKIIATRELVNPDAVNPIVRAASIIQSDLLLTTEDNHRKRVAKHIEREARKNAPNPKDYKKGGRDINYLADKKAYLEKLHQLGRETDTGSEDIVIFNEVEDTKIQRNRGGAIMISTNSPILTTSLQCQTFVRDDFRKAIDTSFNELVGKM